MQAEKVFKKFLFLLISLTVVSCSSESGTETVSPNADEPESENYKVLDSSGSITLNGVKGKRILYANYNNDTTTMPLSKLRQLVSYSDGSRAVSVSENSSQGEIVSVDADEENQEFIRPCNNIYEVTGKNVVGYDSSSRNVDVEKDAESSLEIDTSVRNLAEYNTMDSSGNYVYNKNKDFTLRAIGTKDSAVKCYVWVDDDYYNSDGSYGDDHINKKIAEDIAKKFTEYCDMERKLCGSESDYLLVPYNGSASYCAYKELSEKIVNILVYDIGGDYYKTSKCGVIGFFSNGDFYSNQIFSTSNEGKYFYVDSAYCNYDSKNKSYTGTGEASEVVITTLFHEFQHMINFNQKCMGGGNISKANLNAVETWYNEMLSMLVEDVMNDALGVSDAPWQRLNTFNKFYWLSGIDEYREVPYSSYSYATAYAFGAFLARNFGGPELLRHMCQGTKRDMDSVISAIKSVTGKSYSARQLYKKFIESCAFRTSFAVANGLPTLYKEPGNEIIADGKTCKMKKLNLFASDYKWNGKSSSDSNTYFGPWICENLSTGAASFPSITGESCVLRPHGFMIHQALVADSDSITLNFSDIQDQNEQILIFIQDDFSETTADEM